MRMVKLQAEYFQNQFEPWSNGGTFTNLKKYVEEYVRNYNSVVKDNGSVCPVVINFVRMKDLRQTDEKDIFKDVANKEVGENKKLVGISDYTNSKSTNELKNAKPVIVIGLEDITLLCNTKLPNCEQKDGPDNQSSQKKEEQERKIIEALNLDMRVHFFDSSIWFHYVPLNDKFEQLFKDALDDIRHAYEQKGKDGNDCHVYQTNVAKEFLEFQTRKMVNSFLAPIGGHAAKVSPFKFHSERIMKAEADKLKKKLEGYKWELLIVDDYANSGLRVGQEPYGSESGPNKLGIIKRVLNPNNEQEEWISLKHVRAENNSFVEGFKRLYKKQINRKNHDGETDDSVAKPGKMYDIILLDFLLAGEGQNREFCTDILRWIKVVKEYDKKLQGPLGRFWFFPISVFAYALQEEVRQMGYTQYDDDWVIARGADPVNTPELFRYSLFKLMEAQLNEVYLHSVGENNMSGDNKDLLMGFIKKYFENSKDIQKTAENEYATFLELYSNHKTLAKDSKKDSLFATSVLRHQKLNSAHLFEHFQHLIYMLAYEPAYEWAKMWDEFVIVKQKVKESFSQSEPNLEFLESIEKYIIDLQKQVSSA